MTKPMRDDGDTTPFGAWLHREPELDSKRYKLVVQNLDFVFICYGKPSILPVMVIEEKRFMAEPDWSQRWSITTMHHLYSVAHGTRCNDNGHWKTLDYCGYHLLQFERTSPVDGRIYWDRVEISRQQLIAILRFDKSADLKDQAS